MKSIESMAESAATSCFLNSLLREWQGWQRQSLPAALMLGSGVQEAIRLPLVEHPELQCIWLPLQRYSIVGRHRYALPGYAEDQKGKFMALELLPLAAILLNEGAIVGCCSEAQKQVFLQRLQSSRDLTAEALEARKHDVENAFGRPLRFCEAEQLLIVGHSLHPTPKSRDEFSPADRKLYSPELAGRFPLAWAAVASERLYEYRSVHFKNDWIEELVANEADLGLGLPAGFRLLPLHPWQAERLKQHPALQNAIKSGAIQFLGARGQAWYPTSSLRSLYRANAPYMLKFSLSLKLTNSIRHLLLHEVERGVQVHDVLESEFGQQLLGQHKGLHVIREPAFAMLIDDQGHPLQESIVVCRENPFQDADDAQALVLATLTQDDPLGRGNLIAQAVRSLATSHNLTLADATGLWFKRFCEVALEPLMDAQANYGILLGAHQQNMLLQLRDHLPERLYFRDCQGTGYAAWAWERMRDKVPSLQRENGNVLTDTMAVQLFTYYLIINTSFNVVAALADLGAMGEEQLLAAFRLFVQGLVDRGPRDPRLLQELLTADKLMHKGNFHCSVQSINENTSDNPLAIYTPIHNPML